MMLRQDLDLVKRCISSIVWIGPRLKPPSESQPPDHSQDHPQDQSQHKFQDQFQTQSKDPSHYQVQQLPQHMRVGRMK